MQQLIHVKIGLTDGVYPVRKFYTEGVFKDIYEYQENANTIAWVHKRWCTPVDPQQSDTDWRGFLRTHWDNEHGYCRVDCLQEFMTIFNRAAAAYINKKQHHEQTKKNDNSLHQSGAHDTGRTDTLLHQAGGRRTAAALPQGHTSEVQSTTDAVTSSTGPVSRNTVAAKRPKPVELSLFPELL